MSQAKRDPAPAVVFYHRVQQEKAMTELTQERLKELLHYDPETGVFCWAVTRGSRARKGQVAGCSDRLGYLLIRIDDVLYKAHRLAWLYVHGKWPDKSIDHINRVTFDNRISNLRDVSQSINGQNRGASKISKSGIKGVHWSAYRKRWIAQIKINYEHKLLGNFVSKEDAVAARLQAEQLYFSKA